MIRENLQICGVEITGKCICETKLNVDIFSHAPRQNSPQFLINDIDAHPRR